MTKTEKNTLTKLLSQACQARDDHKCIRCSKRTTLAASHIYPKGTHRKMQFVLENVKTLCYRCHLHFWHKSPIEAWEWVKEALPKKRLDRLHLMSIIIDKTPQDYKLLKLELEQAIKKYD